ncbi:hypothetical protein Clacol_004096 [Clathrus columnatus]|uniref:Exocyst complex component Sec8 n=1 Tax=Clathrus columnatus TaxID=1419009 RepID=A0AAV5A5K9_9AGAM|nr:hypothetical protein Clacol_004096 [Clathrus columnatus]
MSRLGTPNNGRRPKPQVAAVGLPSSPLPDSLVAGRRRLPQEEGAGEILLTPVERTAISAFQSAARAVINGDNERARERERELSEEKERQRRLRDKLQSPRPNGKSRAGDIDGVLNLTHYLYNLNLMSLAILDQLSEEWGSFLDPEFNPVDSALWLLENASDQQFESFQVVKSSLEKTLKGTVENHHQSFAEALPRHASLLTSLTTTQTQISSLRTALQEAREALGTKRADLVQLWSRGQTVEEMLGLLNQMYVRFPVAACKPVAQATISSEYLKSVPDTLESLMTEKRLLQAAVLLVRSLKTIKKPDMLEIGAMTDLRSYLLGQETALKEILVEELHAHLYLKTFWCESRWVAYTPGQRTFSVVEYEKNIPVSDIADPSFLPSSSKPQRLSRFLNDLLVRSNVAPVDVTEESTVPRTLIPSSSSISIAGPSTLHNPESDSFSYLETLLESLAILGQLGNALDIVSQRLPLEIHTLFENTVEEVSERAELNKRTTLLTPGPTGAGRPTSIFNGSQQISLSSLRFTSLESGVKPADQETLRDMFWTLYSKLDAVLQGLRAVFEVSNRIGSRRDFKDTNGNKTGAIFPLNELWYSVQSEIQTLLRDYLVDEERGLTAGRNSLKSINEVLREGRIIRDKSKFVFRFSDSDTKSMMRALKRHEEELTRVLKDTVPGLVQGNSEQAIQASLSSIGADDHFSEASHHRVLIKPDAFHINALFQPTLAFLRRVSEVVPNGTEAARSSSAFMDEFVLNVYLPQLEEKVQALFQSTVSDPDAFQPSSTIIDSSSQLLVKVGGPKELLASQPHSASFKAILQLTALINSLCYMLHSMPYHRENYSRLVLGIIIQFYQSCSDFFRDLVSRPVIGQGQGTGAQVLTSATWAQRPEITACLSAMYSNLVEEPKKRQNLCRQEARIELSLLGGEAIAFEDLLMPTRKLKSLGHLYYSVVWFIERLNALKVLSEEATSPISGPVDTPIVQSTRPPFSPVVPNIPSQQDPEGTLQLPLTKAMALRFDALLKTYEQLAEMIIFTIRTDIRCRAIHYLQLSLQRSNYELEKEPVEPDPHIVELNIEIGKCDDAAVASLPEQERLFVFEGLGALMEQVLISGSKYIKFVNENGVKKILRNVISLQQNLKTLTAGQGNTGLERAKMFYGLYSISPADMLKGIKENKPMFTFDEYRSMLNFQCGVDQSIRDPGSIQAKDPNYNAYLNQLHGLAVGDISDDS